MQQERMVPLFSAAAVHADIDLSAALKRVVDSHWYVLGQEGTAFEAEFAAYLGAAHCVGLANGTDALELGLRAVGVERGQPVVLVANAGFYGSTAVHAIGAQPLYVDVDDASLTLSATGLAQALARKPAAVVVTHLYGQMADIAPLAELCRQAGVPLLEDCAQSHGARRAGRQAGTWGDVGCFSFYPTKNLGAIGDGGAVVARDAAIAARLRSLRTYGWSSKYTVALQGGRNSRLDELQAAVLRTKLPHLERHNAARRAIAQRYNTAFAALPLRCPPSLGEDYVAHLYVLRHPRRDDLRRFLQTHGIATDVHYPVPDHLQPVSAGQTVDLPVTQAASAELLTLPCFPGLTDAEIERVIAAVQGFFAAEA